MVPWGKTSLRAFGHDGLGQIGSETTINSGDLAGILMIAVQALEKRTTSSKFQLLQCGYEEMTQRRRLARTLNSPQTPTAHRACRIP
jgi:hypothetical protein